ncbi:MAG: ATP-binding protein [Anaerovorax sp.]|nr:ATP-binding protein [Anaerovorax sp.]
MKQLKSTVIIVLFLTFLLILNTIGILTYRDSLLSFENQKDNMLKITTKYEMISSMLINNATLYFSTDDEIYQTEFNHLLQTYYVLDIIPIGSRIFTGTESDTLYSSDHMTMEAHLNNLDFTSKESDAFQEFIQSFNGVLKQLEIAVIKKDPSILTSVQYQKLFKQQNQDLLKIYSSYMNRINDKENILIKNQFLLEITLISLSILLFLMGILLFYLLVKENALNLYFRKLYKTIVENINVGLSIQDKDGKYEYMNPKYRELLKVEPQNIMGQTPNTLFSQDVASLLNVSETRPSEGNLKMKLDNEDYYMYYNYFTIFDENKQTKYIDLLHDTTQTEKMQIQLQKQLEEIEFHSRAKDAFLANVSHEIKTPINAIIGMTYFLKETQLSKKQDDLVSKIKNSSNLLLGIINDVLDLSKIKAKNLSFYPSSFALIKVLNNMEDMCIAHITQKGLKFETHYNFDPNLCLYLDRTRLLQVFVNLITNAYKFTDTGHIILSAEVKSETNDTITLQFCVEDSGIGILKEDMNKLFEEFEQLENHLTKKHTGTGLGLTICKYIVEKMGGEIWVTSNIGKGSKFYFTITAKKVNIEQVQDDEVTDCTPKKYDAHGTRILLVEDNEINQEVATNLLTEVNFTCDTAKDGLEAIALCKKHPIDYYKMILMDIHMPRMDGYTASNILRNKLHISCPILAVTATCLDESTKLQYRNIISDFIIKPFKIDTFYNTIYKHLSFTNENKELISPVTGSCISCSEEETAKIDEVTLEKKQENNNDFQNPFAGKQEAIKNLGGLETAYYKHVDKFQKNYKNSAKEIRDFLADENYEKAKRLAHSIKGLAGTLGMSGLHKAATVLDKNISEQSVETETSLEKYESELEAVIVANPHLEP